MRTGRSHRKAPRPLLDLFRGAGHGCRRALACKLAREAERATIVPCDARERPRDSGGQRTEIAPVTSLPRASLPDRTTPMPPAIESLPAPQPQPYERGSKEETTNGSEPSTPSRDGSRRPPETVTVSAPSAWPIVAVAIALAGAVAGLLAWALLVRSKGGGDGLGASSSSGGMSEPASLARAAVLAIGERNRSFQRHDEHRGDLRRVRHAFTSRCADRLLRQEHDVQLWTHVQGSGPVHEGGARRASVCAAHRRRQPRESPYENENLSDPDEYPASEVCVTVAASGQTVAATACLRMKAIAAKKEGARLRTGSSSAPPTSAKAV